jgi:hypothetical protein
MGHDASPIHHEQRKQKTRTSHWSSSSSWIINSNPFFVIFSVLPSLLELFYSVISWVITGKVMWSNLPPFTGATWAMNRVKRFSNCWVFLPRSLGIVVCRQRDPPSEDEQLFASSQVKSRRFLLANLLTLKEFWNPKSFSYEWALCREENSLDYGIKPRLMELICIPSIMLYLIIMRFKAQRLTFFLLFPPTALEESRLSRSLM